MPVRNDYSNILSQKKREVYLGVFISKSSDQNRKALIKQQGFNSGFMEQIAKRGLDLVISEKAAKDLFIYEGIVLLASIRVNGYSYTSLSPQQLENFKNEIISRTAGITNSSLIRLELRSGSLIMDISVILDNVKFGQLSTSEKAFFANTKSVLNSVNEFVVAESIVSANVGSNIVVSGPINVSVTIPPSILLSNGDIDLKIINDSKNNLANQGILFKEFPYPFVGDPIHNCMYTIIFGSPTSIVVRINQNGTMDKICNFPTNEGSDHIFINSDSTYLICQSNVRTNSSSRDRIFLVNIHTGQINTITLSDLGFAGGPLGFDNRTRKFYYVSNMSDNSKYLKLCSITIPSDYASATLSATYYSNITADDRSKIEFITSNVAFMADAFRIFKLDFSVSGGQITVISGGGGGNLRGGWKNNNSRWDQAIHNGPFLDAPIGTNAFFSYCTDITYESSGNQLLICDQSAQRIRSVDLASGNNYYTKTSAGTSPLITGLASNASNSPLVGNYSQTVLDSLNQVGDWSSGNMGPYIKINKTYQTSTFNGPTNITAFNNSIYVRQKDNSVRHLSTGGYVSDFTVIKTFSDQTLQVFNKYGNRTELVATIKVNGYTFTNLTASELNSFKASLAAQLNVDANLITLALNSGSLIMDVSVNYANVVPEKLTDSDKSFFTNIDSVINTVDSFIIDSVINSAALHLKIPEDVGVPKIVDFITKFDVTPAGIGATIVSVVNDCKNDLDSRNKLVKEINNPLIADPINDCMYTVIGTKLVKITKSGALKLIGDYPSEFPFGFRFIFINSASTHLIIPKYDGLYDTIVKNNTIFLFKISTGQLTKITLNNLDSTGVYGFDKANNRLYYGVPYEAPYNNNTNNGNLCYITINDYTRNSTLSATFGFSVFQERLRNSSKLEFVDQYTAYRVAGRGVEKIVLDPANLSITPIVGIDGGVRFSTDPPGTSSSILTGNPFKDGIGSTSYFSKPLDVTFDSENNRLLVCDAWAHRIRSVDLSGNSPLYTVTTIAGTSPIFYGLAINAPNSLTPKTQAELNLIGQIGAWNNGINGMPKFEKKNKSYLESTFRFPLSVTIFNKKIYVRTLDDFPYDDLTPFFLNGTINEIFRKCTTRQLSNGKVSDFTLVDTLSEQTLQVFNATGTQLLTSIKVNGFTYNTLTPSELNSFKIKLALQYGLDASLITLVLSPGSLNIEVSINYANIVPETLTDNDKSFFTNLDAVINSINSFIIVDVINSAALTQKIPEESGISKTVDFTTKFDITPAGIGATIISLINTCKNDLDSRNKLVKQISNPLVADPINNCMYTIVGTKLVKITKSGLLEEIGNYPSELAFGCRFIFINNASTHLIIPKFDGSSSASVSNNKVYLIGIITKQIKEITLSDIDDRGTYGFDKVNNRLYYSTTSTHPTNRYELCYITIPDYTINSNLSATFGFSDISANEELNNKGKIEFISGTIAFVVSPGGITRLDLGANPPSKAVIAGASRVGNFSGYWTNSNNIDWYSSLRFGGPYLDAATGTNAFFSWATDVTYDSIGNQLLICDSFSHRIRSIDLAVGNNYHTKTIAGTTPIRNNVAGSINTNTYDAATLNSLGQVGAWNNGINGMPNFEKKNKSYLESTFRYPIGCVVFNEKIYVRTLDDFQYDDLTTLPPNITNPYDYCTTRQLSNGYVSDFTVIKSF